VNTRRLLRHKQKLIDDGQALNLTLCK